MTKEIIQEVLDMIKNNTFAKLKLWSVIQTFFMSQCLPDPCV